jgi:hypothetical protein
LIRSNGQLSSRPGNRVNSYLFSGIGSAVVDLIFSMAKRDVTFFNGTAAIKRL